MGLQPPDEIRDAREQPGDGHGRASIRRLSLEIYSLLFMQRLTSAFKGKQPEVGWGGSVQRDGEEDEER